jgi:uncharacterized membrane protein
MNQRTKGILAALGSAFFLGLTPIFGKQSMLLGFTPLAVVAIRTTMAAFLFFVFLLVFRKSFFYIYPLGLIGCLLAGLVNGLGSILFYTGLSRIDAGIGQLLIRFIPYLWHSGCSWTGNRSVKLPFSGCSYPCQVFFSCSVIRKRKLICWELV